MSKISYSGQIVLKKYRNGKLYKTLKYRNNGTFALFNYICRCLSGKHINDQNGKPYVLDIGYRDEGGEFVSLLVSTNKPIWADSTVQSSNQSAGDPSCYVDYTFFVYSPNVDYSAVSTAHGTIEYALRGYDAQTPFSGDILATVTTDVGATSLVISTNEVWNIIWRLTVQDK